MMTKLNCKVEGDKVTITKDSLGEMYIYLSKHLKKKNGDKFLDALAYLIEGNRTMAYEILKEFE